MTKQTINVGTSPNDNRGDSLRAAFQKINANFTELYTSLGLVNDANLNLGAFEFNGSVMTTTDSSSITIDQQVNISSDLVMSGNVVPSATDIYDLGSPTRQWRSLYVKGGTVYFDGIPLSVTDDGTIIVNGQVAATPGGEFTWDSISDKPAIPADISDLTDTNDVIAAKADASSVPTDVSDLTDAQGLLAHNDPTKLVNGSEEVTLEENGNLLLANGGRIIGGSTYTETMSIIPNIEKDTQIGIISQDENEQVAIGTSGGLWQFMGNGTMYIPGDIRGSDDLYVKSVTGDTSSGLYINGNPLVGSVVLYANSVATIRADSDGTVKDWAFDKSGTITTPLLLPKTFTAVLDSDHFATQPGRGLTDTPWQFTVEFAVNPDGTVQTQMDDPTYAANPGYIVGDTFRFTEADHGIPGYNFDLLLGFAVDGDSGLYSTQVSVSPPPEYPSTVATTGAIKLTADTQSWVFGTDGDLTAPGDINAGYFIGQSLQITDAGVVSSTYAGDLPTLHVTGNVDNGLTLGTNGGLTSWLFKPDGTITLPAGGDILDSNGTSVLGSASLTVITPEEYEVQGVTTLAFTGAGVAVDRINDITTVTIAGGGDAGGDSLTDDQAVTVTVGNTEYWAIVNRANNKDNGVEASAVAYDSEDNMVTLHISEVYNSTTDQNSDILIVSKYDTSANLLWQKQIEQDVDVDTTHDICFDDSDNIIIATSVDNGADDDTINIVKLNPSGSILWQKEYKGTVPTEITLAVEPAINLTTTVNVEGTDYTAVLVSGTVDYDPTGWVFQESADEITWNTLSTVSLSQYNSENNETSLLFPAGAVGTLDYPTKSYRLVGEGVNSFQEVGAVVYNNGYIYVGGYYEENSDGPYNSQGIILKVDSDTGSSVYAKTFVIPGGSTFFFGMDVGADGNLVVIGKAEADGVPTAAFATKIDGTDGSHLWTQFIFEPTPDISHSGGDVVVDSQNNVFISINSNQAIKGEMEEFMNTTTIAHIIKLNSSGVVQWMRRVGPGPCASVATGIDCDDTGNVYLSALTVAQDNPVRDINEPSNTSRNVLAIAKYSTAGAVLWQRYLEAEGYWFSDVRDNGNAPPGFYSYDYDNRGRYLSLNSSGKLAVQVTVQQKDIDDDWNDELYWESITFQIDQDGREMTIGSGNEKFTVKESRIPGKFVDIPTSLASGEDLSLTAIASLSVTTSTLTLADGELAQQTAKSAPYEYVFGNDGGLTIPNDGDVKLTQTQIGWFSIFGPANNDYDNIDIRCSVVDASTGDVYVAGESDDSSQGFVARYNSQGEILWSIRLEDNTDGYNNRCNAIKLRPDTGNVVVLCEYYGNETGTLVLEIDADTAKVVNSFGVRDQGDNGGSIAYDFDFFSNGDVAIVGRKYDEYRQFPVTPETGSTTSTLIITTASVTEGPLPISNGWYMYGTGITGRTTIQYVNRYTGLTGTVNQGIGAGFQIDIDYSASTNYAAAGTANLQAGSNYTQGDIITIPGTSLGGATPANDLTVTVNSVDGSGAITDYAFSGTAQNTYVKIQIAEAVDFGGSGSWSVAYPLGGEGFVLRYSDEIVWSKVLSAGNFEDTERYLSVAIDSSDNIYAAGEMRASNDAAGSDLNSYWCAVVSKFNSSGAHQWTKALNTTLNDSYAKSVAVRGSTVVVGHNENGYNTVVTKLDTSGNVKWQRSTYSMDDNSVAIDTNGDIYAVIESNFENKYEDVIKLIKFASNGEISYRKFFGTLTYEYGGTNENFKNGRNLTIDADHLYVSGYTSAFADDYRNGFLVKLPKTGDCDGYYGIWTVQTDMYDVNKADSTEATTFTPVIGAGEWETWSSDFVTNWWDPSDDSYYQTFQEIRDRDGGAIEFADGTRQTSSAQQIPQRKISNGADHRLTLEDMGKHIYVTDSNTSINVPYHWDNPLPIGFTVVIINNSGGSINIDGDGGSVYLTVPGVDNNQYWDLADQGMATLIKVEESLWFMTGNVSVD